MNWITNLFKKKKKNKMVYSPLTEQEKQQWVDWLTSLQVVLDGMPEDKSHDLFRTGDGTIATGKDIVGKFLATISNKTITIN